MESKKPIERFFFLAKCEILNKEAVTKSMEPTSKIFPEKSDSTSSLKNTPTKATGKTEISSLLINFISSSHLKRNKALNNRRISLRNTKTVLRTVAP